MVFNTSTGCATVAHRSRRSTRRLPGVGRGDRRRMAAHRSIKRNTLINLAGATAPMLISLVIVPLYLRLVGEARFGVLVLVWLFVGYFEFFDFGIGKATANHMARLRDAPTSEREAAFWTGALINGMLGLLGGLVLLVAGHYGVDVYFGDKLSGELDNEIRMALPWMAL